MGGFLLALTISVLSVINIVIINSLYGEKGYKNV